MRFKSRLVRRLASATYFIRSILNLGVTVFTPCVALKTVMGLPYWFSIILITSIAIVFTLLVRQILFISKQLSFNLTRQNKLQNIMMLIYY